VSPTNRRLSATVILTLLGAVSLTGCTGGDDDSAVSADYTAWMSQSSAQLQSISTGNEGGAGGRLTAEDGSKNARAVVFLSYSFAGPYDVVAACRSSKKVHLTIRDFTEDGGGADPQSVLGSADITCGVPSRIPIDVPKGRSGIELDASSTDRSGQALFNTYVVAPEPAR
jgi:hypothetical protein